MTLDATTQHYIRLALILLSHYYKMDRIYKVPRLYCNISIDIIDLRSKDMHRYKYCQMFRKKHMFAVAYLIEKKSDCYIALK